MDNNLDNNPFPDSPVMPTMYDGNKAINFRCHRNIACWNACCSNIDISLTPYDVLRLKQRLELSSGEFLNTYTVPYEIEKESLAGVKLRPVENGTACRFMTPEGCGVYSDRPTACRYYPVALLSIRKQDEYTDQDSYALVQEPHCQGHKDPRTITINNYRTEQGLPEYDDLARGWRQLILKKKSSGPSIGKPSKRSLQLFFMACYDLDRFREFVASDGFTALFDLPAEELLKILSDDIHLMEFSFRFLRQTLCGEISIAVHAETAEKRLERQNARNLRLEREAAERMERDEGSGFDDECSSN